MGRVLELATEAYAYGSSTWKVEKGKSLSPEFLISLGNHCKTLYQKDWN